MSFDSPPMSHDPYDPWMTRLGVAAKRLFYANQKAGKVLSIGIALADWMTPQILRTIARSPKRSYPITVAQWILTAERLQDPGAALEALLATRSPLQDRFGIAWGLGFPWMSKNGLYQESIPFITHTPYAMEALIKLAEHPSCEEAAKNAFDHTYAFLDSLLVMYSDSDQLALSYAPIDEPRIVVNANAYACFSYALHASAGNNYDHSVSQATKLATWVIDQQNEDGSWHYYADRETGNFIDCFHSCFVIKNLIKAGERISTIRDASKQAISNGMDYLRLNFLDNETGLVKRFTERDIKDPYVWDLYDQAEYLGVLVQTGQLDEAKRLDSTIAERFCKNGNWYSRIDILGRRWGKNFLRWGVMPYLLSKKELTSSLNAASLQPVN